KDFPVDVYGDCGTLKCARGGECENMLDDSYHFYIAFENSICDDYITEKLWNQGYRRDIIPIVLKRSLVEQLVPPNSFIAADDFNTTKDLAAHLHYLMFNKSAYTEYFQWRREYKVVFLDGKNHDALERPWGFCQVFNTQIFSFNPRKFLAMSSSMGETEASFFHTRYALSAEMTAVNTVSILLLLLLASAMMQLSYARSATVRMNSREISEKARKVTN
ncbi:hypothetical protein NECAME_16936, partial [Necator americanus]